MVKGQGSEPGCYLRRESLLHAKVRGIVVERVPHPLSNHGPGGVVNREIRITLPDQVARVPHHQQVNQQHARDVEPAGQSGITEFHSPSWMSDSAGRDDTTAEPQSRAEDLKSSGWPARR